MLKALSGRLGAFIVAIVAVAIARTLYVWLRKKPADERLRRIQPIVDLIYKFWRGARTQMIGGLSLIQPGISEEEASRYAYQAACMVGANGALMLGAESETTDHIRSRVRIGPGFVQMIELSNRGERVVFAPIHSLPFDGALGIVDVVGVKAALVVEKLPWPIRPIFSRTRSSWEGIDLVPITRGRTYEEAQRRLLDGEVVVVLADIFRPPGRKDGVDVRIGNAVVGVSTMPVRLARENDAVIYTLITEWDPDDGKIFLDARPFMLQHTSDEHRDIREATIRLGHLIGEQIQERPGSWMRLVWDRLTPAA